MTTKGVAWVAYRSTQDGAYARLLTSTYKRCHVTTTNTFSLAGLLNEDTFYSHLFGGYTRFNNADKEVFVRQFNDVMMRTAKANIRALEFVLELAYEVLDWHRWLA